METTTENDSSYKLRARSARRLRHEAEAHVFEKQAGSLESLRGQLGLRPSQICEILKVHPSAWTRWTRPGAKAPPHVYQMLEWYVELLQWRGQYHPARRGPEIVKTLRQEDPATYVPEGENRPTQPVLKVAKVPLHPLVRVVFWLSAAQTLLCAGLLWLVLRHSA